MSGFTEPNIRATIKAYTDELDNLLVAAKKTNDSSYPRIIAAKTLLQQPLDDNFSNYDAWRESALKILDSYGINRKALSWFTNKLHPVNNVILSMIQQLYVQLGLSTPLNKTENAVAVANEDQAINIQTLLESDPKGYTICLALLVQRNIALDNLKDDLLAIDNKINTCIIVEDAIKKLLEQNKFPDTYTRLDVVGYIGRQLSTVIFDSALIATSGADTTRKDAATAILEQCALSYNHSYRGLKEKVALTQEEIGFIDDMYAKVYKCETFFAAKQLDHVEAVLESIVAPFNRVTGIRIADKGYKSQAYINAIVEYTFKANERLEVEKNTPSMQGP